MEACVTSHRMVCAVVLTLALIGTAFFAGPVNANRALRGRADFSGQLA